VVLMDVDCIVRGDISPVTDIATDVALSIKPRLTRNILEWQRRIVVTAGSRVMVFRPTEGARSFLREWERLCVRAKSGGSVELHLAWVFLLRPDITYTLLDGRYTGRELDISSDVPNDVVICHDRAHGKRTMLRAIEQRWFRKGRTKAAMRFKLG